MEKILFIFLLATVFLYNVFSFAAPTEECKQRLENLDSNWRYDKIEVPFDWEYPETSEKIEVYYYFKNQALVQNKVPIIFINGGPTISSIAGIPIFSKIKKLNEENLILMDQRGTGCSTPFLEPTDKNIENFKKYGSESIVTDAEAIRKKMFGEKKWKVYGQSFGGLTSFRYLEMFPNSIESAHIHGFGFSENAMDFLDARETRLQELTNDLLNYNNPKVSSKTIGEIINIIVHSGNEEGRIFYKNLCIEIEGVLKNKFCGQNIFDGLFLMIGFYNMRPIIHEKLFKISEYIESKNLKELDTFFRNFAHTYVLRFNKKNQVAALNIITYTELIPGRFFYDGCTNVPENLIFSECRFGRLFIIPFKNRPTFQPNPIDLDKVKNNISEYKIPIYYYAGRYDTFSPVHFPEWTAMRLNIENSFHIFESSGHEGYYSEDLVISNLIKN